MDTGRPAGRLRADPPDAAGTRGARGGFGPQAGRTRAVTVDEDGLASFGRLATAIGLLGASGSTNPDWFGDPIGASGGPVRVDTGVDVSGSGATPSAGSRRRADAAVGVHQR